VKRRLQSAAVLLSAALLAACGTLEMEGEYTPTHERATTAAPVAPVTQVATPAAPTPTPPADLGQLAYIQGGDVWVKELPDGEPQHLTDDGRNSEPHWSPSGEWLTFRKGDDVWVMRADGTDARHVPMASSRDCAWSPVADRLAYISGQASLRVIEPDTLADTGLKGEGYTLLRTGIEEQPLTTIHGLAWSPDGRRLAYVLLFARPDALPQRDCVSIGTADLESGPRELYALPSPPQDGLIVAGWTPDGQSVLFWRDPMFSAAAAPDGLPLLRAPLGGGEPIQVADFTLLHADFWSGSPTGRHVALTVGAGRETWTNKRIALVDLERDGWEYLTDEAVSAFSPAFSPDGRQIAYVAAPDVGFVGGGDLAKAGAAQRRICVMNADGSDQRPLTDDPAYRDERPLWSANGSHVLFARMDEQDRASLWIVAAEGGIPRQVVDNLTLDEVTGWFGYYGHIDWDDLFDWWQG
jgi:Tol biopolymer transport system component